MKDTVFTLLEKTLGKDKLKTEERLDIHTTWRVGGPAKYWFEAKLRDDLVKAVQIAVKMGLSYFILGGGSNVLFGDKGFNGLVIKNNTSQIKISGMGGKISGGQEVTSVLVEADSGVMFNRLVRFSLDEGLSGLEPFLGQPGTVGGAVYINAHFMKENEYVGNHLVSAEIVDKDGKKRQKVSFDYFQFDYDQSSIQKSKDVVLGAVFKLRKTSKENAWQKGNAAIAYRQQSQPQGYPSAGCTFRNIPISSALALPTPGNTQSAGFLLDQCGLKGMKRGGAEFSDRHANFIINRQKATALDIRQLIELAKKAVKDKFGVLLKEEIIMAGDF